jgi:Protein of unknown function (DUF4031)
LVRPLRRLQRLLGRRVAVAAADAPATDGVTVYVDECRWWWRGRQWCHLISDTDLLELHSVASSAGVPRWAFQGDHYDLHVGVREMAIRAGAIEVTSREVVVLLRASGLRITPAQRRGMNNT